MRPATYQSLIGFADANLTEGASLIRDVEEGGVDLRHPNNLAKLDLASTKILLGTGQATLAIALVTP